MGVETVRFYEREGSSRSPAGGRPATGSTHPTPSAESASSSAQKELGFTLREIRELLSLRVAADKTCADVRDLAVAK